VYLRASTYFSVEIELGRPFCDALDSERMRGSPGLPVVELLFAYRSTLSRTVEGQTVIAAPDCRGGTEIEKYPGRVVPS